MGSSLVNVGLSMVVFVISFGLLFYLIPATLGPFFTAMPPVMNASWLAIYNKNIHTIQFLIPLTLSLGIFVFALKVLMVATNRGND